MEHATSMGSQLSDMPFRYLFEDLVAVNVPDQQACLAEIENHLREGRGFSIATLNLDHIIKIRSSMEFRDAYLRHTHVTADGNPIVWLARLAGQDVSLVPGSELIDPVVALAEREGVPIAFLGSTEGSLDKAANALKARYPDLQIAASLAPPMGFDPTGAGADEMISALKASDARICFLALGAPKQEVFATYASAQLPHMGFVSIGAGLDFIAGEQVRAPRIVRKLALEWLWRMLQNPKRLGRRYLMCILILPYLLWAAAKKRLLGT